MCKHASREVWRIWLPPGKHLAAIEDLRSHRLHAATVVNGGTIAKGCLCSSIPTKEWGDGAGTLELPLSLREMPAQAVSNRKTCRMIEDK